MIWTIVALLAGFFVISPALAGLSVDLVEVPISAAAISNDSNLNGMRSLQVQVTVTGDTELAGADMQATLGSGGAFYYAALHSNVANPTFWPLAASLEFDTWIHSALSGNSGPDTNLLGSHPLDGGAPPAIFDAQKVSAAWGKLTNVGAGTYVIANLTVNQAGYNTGQVVGRVVNTGSTLVVPFEFGAPLPEPASIALLGLGCLALLRRRS